MSTLKVNTQSLIEHSYKLYKNDYPFVIDNFIENVDCIMSAADLEFCLNNPNYPGYILHQEKGKIVSDDGEWNVHPNVKERFDALRDGHGICIMGYGEHSKETNDLMGVFEQIFDVNAKLYLQVNFNSTEVGFGLHADDRDMMGIFIVQIEGYTDWKIFKNRQSGLYAQDRRYDGISENDLEIDLYHRLLPGQLLYIPHRTFHLAKPSSRRVSLSIPCLARNRNSLPDHDRNFYKLNIGE